MIYPIDRPIHFDAKCLCALLFEDTWYNINNHIPTWELDKLIELCNLQQGSHAKKTLTFHYTVVK